MLTFWSSLDRFAPYLSGALVLYSIAVPSRDIRTVRDLRSEVASIRHDTDSVRDDFVATLNFLRSWSPEQTSGVDAPDGAPRRRPVQVTGGAYTRCRGVDGVRIGNDTWLIGDPSPWGVIACAYPGGFETSDGSCYTYFSSSDGVTNDK